MKVSKVLHTGCLLAAASPAWASAAETSAPSRAAGNDGNLPVSIDKAYALSRAISATFPEKMPACDIVAVESEAKSVFSPRPDGAWRVRPTDRPGQDVITLKLKPKSAGVFLRLDFPTDSTLPAQGPGLASNGNSVIGEIEIELNGKPLKTKVQSVVSQSNGGRVAETAFDGVRQQGDKGWEAEASGWELGGSMPARLVLRLDTAVPAGASLTVRLIAKSRFGAHVPGIVSAAVVGGEAAYRAVLPLADARADFDRWSAGLLEGLRRRAAFSGGATLLADKNAADLARAELLRSCGAEKVWAVATRKGGGALLRALLSEPAWLDSFLIGGVEGTGRCDFAQSLENLRLLYANADKSVWSDPVAKKIATAFALEAGAINRYSLLRSFNNTREACDEGRLHGGFGSLDVRAMRHAINPGMPTYDFRGWLDEANTTAGGYLGACWAVPYTDPSTYGYSVQGWGYHNPMYHAYPTGKVYRSIGGVCGTLSRYGAGAAIAHGVPAFTVGQPAHCAYVVRLGDHWATGNDVSGPATNSWTAYEGVSFVTTNALLEQTENSAAWPRAARMLWVARLLRDSGAPTATWANAYEQALTAQPSNYAVWHEYMKALEATPGALTPRQWLDTGLRAAKAFTAHHEAGWALALRCFKSGETAVPKPADRVALLCEAHKILCQKSQPALKYGYPMIGDFLNREADWIGDPAKAVEFYGRLMVIHHSEDPNLNWVFGGVLGWGSARFAQNPATASVYAKVMGDYFSAQGSKADKGQIAGTVVQGMRKAAEVGDAASYNTWQTVARRLLPPLGPGDVHLNAGQVAARPKFEPFPGTLLSANAMLRTSSASYDTPLSYDQVLGGGEFGYFDTNPEAKPTATVTLAGDGELSGIVLVNRYELPVEHPWDVPLKVEVSTDGKQWTQVALFEKAAPVYRVDLRGKGVRARYVRIERQPGPEAAGHGAGRLHMRNFLVYGKKLY